MESGEGASTAPARLATLGGPDGGPGRSVELPGTDPGKLQALPVGPGAPREDPALGSSGGRAAVGDGSPDTGPAGEPSSNAKVPNRDSGIDSPSCSIGDEPFCEDGGAAGLGPTLLGLHPEAAPDSKPARKEAAGGGGKGSSEEPQPENSAPEASADRAQVGGPPVPGQRGSSKGSEVCSGISHTWCQPLGARRDATFGEAPSTVGGQALGEDRTGGPWTPWATTSLCSLVPWLHQGTGFRLRAA